MFSKSCQYGLRATIFIAKQSALHNKVGFKAIAKAINSPEAFTAKILQLLTKNNIVTSIKGPYGGFVIERSELNKIRLSDVVMAVDGDRVYTACSLGLERCSENAPCPLHFEFVEVRKRLKHILHENTLHNILYTDDKMNKILLRL